MSDMVDTGFTTGFTDAPTPNLPMPPHLPPPPPPPPRRPPPPPPSLPPFHPLQEHRQDQNRPDTLSKERNREEVNDHPDSSGPERLPFELPPPTTETPENNQKVTY